MHHEQKACKEEGREGKNRRVKGLGERNTEPLAARLASLTIRTMDRAKAALNGPQTRDGGEKRVSGLTEVTHVRKDYLDLPLDEGLSVPLGHSPPSSQERIPGERDL